MATAPTTWATVNVDGRLEVFMIGVNDAGDQGLWHIWQTPHGNGWTPWFSHGIPPGSAGLRWSPAVVCPSDGRIELFVVSDDLQPGGLGSGGALYRKRQTAPDNDWANWVPFRLAAPIFSERRPLQAVPVEGWNFSPWAPTGRSGTAGERTRGRAGRSGSHMAARLGSCSTPPLPLLRVPMGTSRCLSSARTR